MKMNTIVAMVALGISTVVLTGCACPFADCCAPSTPENAGFYSQDGKTFDQTKAKAAYYDLMNHFDYPILPVLKTENFWVSDFGLGDFAHVGMGGIFWVNNNYKGGGYLGHEIYLLPGQMIVEHGHVASKEGPAKRESWLVRYGSCYSFSVQDKGMGELPPFLPQSQTSMGFITCNSWKILNPGDVDTLNREGAKHFLIAGPKGAIVTETGNWHDNAGLRFTNPSAKL